MATSSPSPTSSPLGDPPTSTATSPPQPSTPIPNPPSETNAIPPDSSTLSSPPPPVSSPPLASRLPSGAAPSVTAPPPVPASPPASVVSPPPPITDPPPPPEALPPSPPAPTVPTSPPVSPSPPTVVTPPTSPPPPSIPPSPPATSPPSVPSPPSNPPSSPPPPATKPESPPPPATKPESPPPPATKPESPPPPATKPKSPPTSSLHTPHHSPPPPAAPKFQPPESQPSPPHFPSPQSNIPSARPASAPQSSKNSPSPPSQEPPSASPPQNSSVSTSRQISPSVSHLSPPPVSAPASSSQLLDPSSANSPLANSTASSPSNGGLSGGGTVAIGVAVGVIMLGLIGMVVWYMSKRKRRTSQHSGGYIMPSPYGSSPRSDSNLIIKTPFVGSGSGSGALSPNSHGGLGHSQSWFTYQELFEATNGFAFDNLLGEGGFGTVYKGILANGREVAVKKLKIDARQGEREFKAEIETISRVHHRHLVSLVGYCIYESKRLLVYNYVPNQTLHYHLHGEDRPVMDWATRMKIAEGAARGIAYLHEDCHPRIIHRDIKSSNILLDEKFEARVSDFGLAKVLDVDTHVSTRVMGTFGYMAPEYATSGKLTEKSDVYSFGVVILELITGRKPVDESQPLGDESLVEWARPLLSHALETGQVEGLVDPRLEKDYVESQLFLMIEAAAACVRHSATNRPRMGQVVRAFDGLSPSDLTNGMRVGQSEIYDSAQQSAEIRLFRRMAFGSQENSGDFFLEASRNLGYSNPYRNDEGAGFSTQQKRNDLSQQPSENMYFSSHWIQSRGFSEQRSQNPNISAQSSQNPFSVHHRSQNPTFSGRSSQNLVSSGPSNQHLDSSSKEGQSS